MGCFLWCPFNQNRVRHVLRNLRLTFEIASITIMKVAGHSDLFQVFDASHPELHRIRENDLPWHIFFSATLLGTPTGQAVSAWGLRPLS